MASQTCLSDPLQQTCSVLYFLGAHQHTSGHEKEKIAAPPGSRVQHACVCGQPSNIRLREDESATWKTRLAHSCFFGGKKKKGKRCALFMLLKVNKGAFPPSFLPTLLFCLTVHFQQHEES